METLEQARVAPGPTPFVAQAELPAGVDEAMLRAAAVEAAKTGDEVVTLPGTQTSQVQGAPALTPDQALAAMLAPNNAPPAPTNAVAATPNVPAKFVKPDGTVDVEKLQTSTEQLRAGIQDKVLSIDEMVAQYKELETQFRTLPRAPEQVAAVAQAAAQPTQIAPPPFQPQVDPNALHAQIMAAYQADPINTVIDLVRMVSKQETKPIQEFVQTAREAERTSAMKNNVAELARIDPRITNPLVYQEIVKEIQADPGYLNLRNPQEAAWYKVKARLRLGDVQPTQPGKPASPILGGGTPPPVPSTSAGANVQNLGEAVRQAKNPNEMKSLEDHMRQLAQNAQW